MNSTREMLEEDNINSTDLPPLNDTNNGSQLEAPPYIVITATVFYVLIFVVGILGNVLVTVVVTCSRTMKTSVNLYLMNLCMADILVILVCMPTALTDIYARDAWYFGEFMCKVVPFLENTVANASVLTILAISIERYKVVCYPLKGIEVTTMKVLKIVVAIWIASVSTSAPWISIPTLKLSRYPDGTPVTVCRNPIKHTWQNVYIVTLFVLFFLLPCLILFILNCHLCRVLHHTQENNPRIPGNQNQKERKKRRQQVVNIIASIVSIFFICHLPFRIVFLWYSFGDKYFIYSLGLEFNLGILYLARIMFYLNHAINPVIYNFVSTKFRTALREICCGRNSSYQNYASIATPHGRRNDLGSGSICLNNIRSTTTRHFRLSNKWTPTLRLNQDKRFCQNDVYKTTERGSRSSNENSTSSSKDYDVKIRLEDKTVAIKFNIRGKNADLQPVSI